MTADAQREVNRSGWERPDLVSAFATRTLRPPEIVLLLHQRDALAGRVLELGCGAGRLTGYLLDIGATVHGIDIQPAMVSYCRSAYPDGTYAVGDLLDVADMEDASYDAVVAGDNVLDVLGDTDRRHVLANIARVLVPGGILMMSTHNIASKVRPPTDVCGDGRLRTLHNVMRLPVRLRNRHRLAPLQRDEPGYAIRNDLANDYTLLHYYISRDRQQEQFEAAGLTLVECMDLSGRSVARGAAAAHSSELHYVARQPG